MYATEAKKRKFDRIIDSITVTNDTKKPRSATPTAHYLPSSREAFLDRLHTFQSVTKWHIPSTETINAAAWAKRGWSCVATDLVACGYCREQLMVKLDREDFIAVVTEDDENKREDEDLDTFSEATEVRATLVGKYENMIVTSHQTGCPWRHRGCIDSIQRIPGLLNSQTTLGQLLERYNSIAGMTSGIPKVHLTTQTNFYDASAHLPPSRNVSEGPPGGTDSPETISHHQPSEATSVEQSTQTILSGGGRQWAIPKIQNADVDVSQFRFEQDPAPINQNALLLAICGWQRAGVQGLEILECQHCFRSIGLWLYREGAMDKLEGIESHLEYCPWRSPDAQDTELEIGGHKEKLAGWALVAQTVKKTIGPLSTPVAVEDSAGVEETEEVVVKAREKKMKDLLRRVKELKKPFNVKALLRKKT